jgi:hypothetical protein
MSSNTNMADVTSKLYRYGSLQNPEFLREVLLENKIYCTCPLDFNDPFDCRPRVVVGNTPKELKEAHKVVEDILKKRTSFDRPSRKIEAKKIIQEIDKSVGIAEQFEELLGRAGVYCLTSKRDNLLMWAHYADGHKGFCLEFTTNPSGSFFSNAEPVSYRKEYPVVKAFAANTDIWGKECFLTKSIDWAYEEEWRLTSRETGHLEFPPELLTGIIFGCKINTDHIGMINEWIDKRAIPIKIKKAVMDDKQFRIDILDF